ncbi:MAG: DHH family phosphoesterase [Candidatus Margulisiibacteriota bacterium]
MTTAVHTFAEHWSLANPDDQRIQQLIASHKIPAILARILVARNLDQDSAYLQAFVSPPMSILHDYEGLTDPQDLQRAVDRLRDAIRNQELIMVNGDPDADGITASTVLVASLRKLGGNVQYDFPVRSTEGHGLQPRIIEKAAGLNGKVIITADCGSKNAEAIAYANSLGLETIVCDHHILGKSRPECFALINPFTVAQKTGFKSLSAAAVSYKLMVALFAHMRQPMGKKFEDYLLAIASLGTLSDRMSLLEPMNRLMVNLGVEALNRTGMEGLKAIKQVSIGSLSELKPRDISRTIAPRLNAPGRIGNPAEGIPDSNLVVDLLLVGTGPENAKVAKELASRFETVYTAEKSAQSDISSIQQASVIDDVNERRKLITSQIEDEIERLIAAQVNPDKDRIIIVSGRNWNPGVIGIDTDRLRDRFLRPAIIVTSYTGSPYVRGSVRSIPTIDIYSVVDQIGEDFRTRTGRDLFQVEVVTKQGHRMVNAFGGHAQACGFTIHEDDLPEFTARVRAAMDQVPPTQFHYTHEIIDKLTFGQITPDLIHVLDQLSPYGQRFEYPIFLLEDVRLGNQARPFGNRYQQNRTPHVDFIVLREKGGRIVQKFNAVGFGLWEKYQSLKGNNGDGAFDLIFTLEVNAKRGGRRKESKIRLNVLDIRSNGK